MVQPVGTDQVYPVALEAETLYVKEDVPEQVVEFPETVAVPTAVPIDTARVVEVVPQVLVAFATTFPPDVLVVKVIKVSVDAPPAVLVHPVG